METNGGDGKLGVSAYWMRLLRLCRVVGGEGDVGAMGRVLLFGS
jgi:hypothetical protein